MQQQMQIQAAVRSEQGKTVDKLRRSGKVPAVLYGHKVEKNILLSVDRKEFEKLFKLAGESTLISLVVDGGKPRTVLVHDIQKDYLKDDISHIDFYEVNMTEKIHTHIPLEFTGQSVAVKDLGGTLTKQLDEIEVECLPADLPHSFIVDISKLATFEDDIKVSDLSVDASKVRLLEKPESIIAVVAPPRSEEELKSLEEQPVTEEVAAVEGVEKQEETAGGEGEEKKDEKGQPKEKTEKE